MSQILEQSRQPEPTKNLVESLPAREGVKLSENQTISSWELMGLTWLLVDDWC